jgi:site-specific DNA recombinase
MAEVAALYARVSTTQQEQEATIESQVAALESYAQQQGYTLSPAYYFLDNGVSGAKLVRPALERLRDQAAEGAFAVVLCLSPDRLARQCAHQWVLLDELQRAGVKVIFISQPLVSDDPQGQLLLGIQGLFGEYERAMITERFRRGRLYRIRRGDLVNPNAPYGYHYIPVSEPGGGHWELEPQEADVVRRIYAWYAGDEGLTIHAIVSRLNQPETHAPARGQRWTYSTVQAILTQPAYTGRAYYNRTRTCHEAVGRVKKHGRGHLRQPEHRPRPTTEWIPVTVPAIIESALGQRAAERLASNQRFAPRNNTRHCYPLRSLLVCDICGRTLAGRTSDGQVYYSCSNRGQNRQPGVPPHSRSIAGNSVTPLVWDALGRLLRNPTLLADAWQAEGDPPNAAPEEADRLQAQLRALERQWTRILDAFQAELLDKAELARRKERLDQERQALTQRLQQAQRQARQQQAKAQMLEDFATFCQQIEAGLTNPTPEQQQEVFRLLIDHVVVEQDAIVIKHIIPTDDDCRLLPGRRQARMHADELLGYLSAATGKHPGQLRVLLWEESHEH